MAGDDRAALIWCPFPDAASAREAATALLDRKLVACANILPPMTSLFVWNGERDESREVGVIFKTLEARLEAAMGALEALHPYDAPAIVGWAADAAAPATMAWLNGSVTGG